MDEPEAVPLRYRIAGCSEHSGKYAPENILEDNPLDQTSRWSGAYLSPNVKQWMLLRLQEVVVLKSITFGKFHKPHPCNMKEFKVYVGISEDNMTEVLHEALRNDSVKETFTIRHSNNAGICFPTRYVKVVPLSAHGQSFHTSIWHIALAGIQDWAFVENVRARHNEYRETSVLRYVLKHLRQRRFLTPFSDILSRTGLRLEHPIVTSLYENLVLNGHWAAAEGTVHQAASAGLFNAYRFSCQPHAQWTQLHGTDADGDVPRRRGGHAMCMDEQNGLLYLFGGWDGQQNLDDFWVYDVHRDTWRMLSMATSREKNGPGPRACHKMVFDTKTGAIYVLGRLGEGDALEPTGARDNDSAGAATPASSTSPRPSGNATTSSAETARQGNVTPLPWTAYCSEFHRYHTRGLDEGKWDLLSFDTSASGGPPLVFDHQMVMDCEAQMIYVSGGRVVDGDWEVSKYSGLYAYDIRTGLWQMLQTSDANGINTAITARFGHSMVLEPESRTLLIFAGQRDERYLSDIFAYHIPTGTVTELFPNFTTAGGPDPCFTQRAVIDPALREIYLFCGLTRSQPGSLTVLETESPYWIYRYERPDQPGTWSTIPPVDPSHMTQSDVEGPQPRYAHQVVYDASTKVVYMHGGNNGIIKDDGGGGPHVEADVGRGRPVMDGADATKENRLDDFWKMTLERPPVEDIVRKAMYEIRQQQFRELCEDVPAVKALAFLQAEVSSVVDHSNAEEAEAFRSLLAHLLSLPPDGTPAITSTDQEKDASMRSVSGTPIPRQGEEGMSGTTRAQPMPSRVAVTYAEDPLEESEHGGSHPSPARFKQRTQVFERLLMFVNADAKQPNRSLVDLINADGTE